MVLNFQDGFGHQALDAKQHLDHLTGNSVISGVTPSIDTGLTITVTSGTVIVDGVETSVPSQSITLDSADGSNPRKDVITVNSSGNLVKYTGVAESVKPETETGFDTQRPAPDDLSSVNEPVIAEIYVEANATSLNSSDLRDRRVIASASTGDLDVFGNLSMNSNNINDVSTVDGVNVSSHASRHSSSGSDSLPADSISSSMLQENSVGTTAIDQSMDVQWTNQHEFQGGLFSYDKILTIGDIEGNSVIYDQSNDWVPTAILEADTITVGSTDISLGGAGTPDASEFSGSSGTSGQVLQTDGSTASWSTISAGASVSDDGTQVQSSPDDINYGEGLDVSDDGDGSVTVDADTESLTMPDGPHTTSGETTVLASTTVGPISDGFESGSIDWSSNENFAVTTAKANNGQYSLEQNSTGTSDFVSNTISESQSGTVTYSAAFSIDNHAEDGSGNYGVGKHFFGLANSVAGGVDGGGDSAIQFELDKLGEFAGDINYEVKDASGTVISSGNVRRYEAAGDWYILNIIIDFDSQTVDFEAVGQYSTDTVSGISMNLSGSSMTAYLGYGSSTTTNTQTTYWDDVDYDSGYTSDVVLDQTDLPRANKIRVVDRDGNAESNNVSVSPSAYDIQSTLQKETSVANRPDGFTFADSGNTIYYISDGTVYELSLSTSYDITTKTDTGNSYTLNGDTLDIVFSPDGSKLFELTGGDTIYEHTLGTAWDLSTASYTGNSYSLSVGYSNITQGRNGTRLYLSSNDSSVEGVTQFNLTSFDVTTITNTGNTLPSGDASTNGVAVSDDGRYVFVGTPIRTYQLNKKWDISTGSSVSTDSVPTGSFVVDFEFYDNGDRLVYATYDNFREVNSYTTINGETDAVINNDYEALTFQSDGEKWFIVSRTSGGDVV